MREADTSATAARVVERRLARRPLERLDGLTSLETAYRVQALANDALETHLGPPVGHKIGGTTVAMRRYLNVPEPLAGEIFQAQVHPSGAVVRRAGYVRLGIETEIAVRLGRDLPPRAVPYARDEAAAAVAEVMAAIELVDDRYCNFATIGAATLIADNAFDAGSVLGPPVTSWQRLDLAALEARTLRDGVVIASGFGRSLLGHPLDALAWLANRRSALGLGLTASTFVSLGSMTPVIWAEAAARYRIEVEGLGAVEVEVA